ncbi:tRNA 2-selenouridine(34) synthase MnmH [Bacillus sp. MRMR6]|uniref:tRNA 2-selenouridine(34) synthase MnmH n=1 Tax=Bacillus sp. MRMR6 TaxID=1928617 RepID=UPI00095267BB|nr:tRNA 2-selenouridine(34) synthase MnmH [Bacillus sp. MRMR6]OLS34375.1 tRNA 2-selenouridine(34) synthase MnmH [Bacillus sp. MRMR6]
MREITVEDLQKLEKSIIIDIRSPIEFDDGSIPGAINIPLFTNEERQEIGTIYKREGQAAAKWRAMERVSSKLPVLLRSIKNTMSDGEELIIHCWRGGMRSKAVVTFLEFAGIHAIRLVGGYKAYRQFILKEIPAMFPDKAIVLHGLTGVGKTDILKKLDNLGYPILDLEEMAGHRGSIFGTIGLGEGNNQKSFDALLHHALKKIEGSAYFIMEAESKRIGKVVQPEELMDKKLHGIHMYIHTPFEHRINHLVNEYVLPYSKDSWFFEKISVGIDKILLRIKDGEMKRQLLTTLENKNYQDMIQILLENYYDPRYDHKLQDYAGEFINIHATNSEDAVEIVINELNRLLLKPDSNVNHTTKHSLS